MMNKWKKARLTMTNELEKQGLVSSDKRARISSADDSSSLLEIRFFDTFGIEPREKQVKHCEDCTYYEETYDAPCFTCTAFRCYYIQSVYPQITDRILLELICIVAKYYCFRWDNWINEYSSVDKLKNFILLELIGLVHQEGIKHQVRTLFEEG